ncbi:MAG: IS66 family insertion sequence element accessory protein TnpB [Solitalea sp.]
MFTLGSSHTYFLYRGACDMRKSFDGLCGLVSRELKREATSGEVFVFLNRRGTHMKLLHWERGGFVLYYKRLEQGTFPLPRQQAADGLLPWSELVLMVEGILIEKRRLRRRFELTKTA